MPSLDESGWISQADAARLRGVSPQAIHKLVVKGRLKTTAIAGRRLVWRQDVLSFIPAAGGRPPDKKFPIPRQARLFGRR